MEKNELYHYGRKGMKWYQNIFTKHRNKNSRRGDSGEEAPKDNASYTSARKSVKEMSDAELKSAINRLEDERRYNDLNRAVNPPTVSRGKQFINDFIDKAAIPAVTEAGRNLVRDKLIDSGKKFLGLSDKDADALSGLKKEVEKLRLTKEKTEISKYLKGEKDEREELREAGKDAEAKKKILDYEEALRKRENNSQKSNDNSNTSSTDKPKNDKSDDSSAKTKTNDSKPKDSDSSSNKNKSTEDKKVYTGTVEDGPKQKQKSTSENKTKKETVIDAEWREVTETTSLVPVPSSSPTTVSRGNSFITALLEDKNR